MKTINIGVCDDEEYFLNKLVECIKVYTDENNYDLKCKIYLNAQDLLEAVAQDCNFDILFLDIEMKPISGIDAADHLRGQGYSGEICFVTSHDEYALCAYDLEAIGYLVKPVKYDALKKVLKKALVQIAYQKDESEATKKYLEINANRGNIILDVDQIIYIEKRRNQSVIHMDDGEKICYEPLRQIFQRLDSDIFGYVHQGFIVNFDKIKEVGNESVYFGDDVEVPLSRKHRREVKERHTEKIRHARGKL
ncbi:MAG: LytTR family DNA-binding domain-containing protein [Acetatifactor sp.]|nr:LytTR family DNA-binding domain-containing protein [Acetatifactor sp.]